MSDYQFVLGFATLARLLGGAAGVPTENEHFNPESGDSLQATRMPNGKPGLMVWRKADNWTAFTDGYHTWINGPFGLQQRLNTARFDWEKPLVETLPAPVIAQWSSPNCWEGRPYGPPIAIVLHTAAGSEGGMEAWFGNPDAQVSAHWGIPLDAAQPVDQFVALTDRAWHAGIREPDNRWDALYKAELGADAVYDGFQENPNNWTVGIETEDRGLAGQPVTDSQYRRTLYAVAYSIGYYPTIKYLLRHADISPKSRPNCPGNRWVASGAFAQLAADARLRTLLS